MLFDHIGIISLADGQIEHLDHAPSSCISGDPDEYVDFPYVTGQGRHRLAEYMKLVGYHVLAYRGLGNTSQRIRYVRRQMVSRCGYFSSITATAKAKWSNLLKHNFHDCSGLRAVFISVIEGLSRS
jgi:hypothetical protein